MQPPPFLLRGLRRIAVDIVPPGFHGRIRSSSSAVRAMLASSTEAEPQERNEGTRRRRPSPTVDRWGRMVSGTVTGPRVVTGSGRRRLPHRTGERKERKDSHGSGRAAVAARVCHQHLATPAGRVTGGASTDLSSCQADRPDARWPLIRFALPAGCGRRRVGVDDLRHARYPNARRTKLNLLPLVCESADSWSAPSFGGIHSHVTAPNEVRVQSLSGRLAICEVLR
jgi:hypothetical protein